MVQSLMNMNLGEITSIFQFTKKTFDSLSELV